jgi:hypothetical protein
MFVRASHGFAFSQNQERCKHRQVLGIKSHNPMNLLDYT